MSEAPRKKSPRAPSIPLDDAVERALKIYDKERRHAAPVDVIAQNLGYKSANNGSALSAIAALRAYGLLEKASEGKLAVSSDIEAYRFAPTEELKDELRIKWLRSPSIFNELLDLYASGLPSDASLRFELINKRSFSPASAETTLGVLKKSIEFSRFFDRRPTAAPHDEHVITVDEIERRSLSAIVHGPSHRPDGSALLAENGTTSGYDRIPVRLVGSRKAWLEVPTPFYEADKQRLIAQIELILTDNEATDSQP
jgi:hypothetical protein